MTPHKKGVLAEWLCCFVLLMKGYGIVARRKQTPLGEVDIVARRGKTFVFIEVKYRSALPHELPVIKGQQQRIERAAQYIMKTHRNGKWVPNVRFDLIVVVPWQWPRHIQGAWRPQGFWS